MENNAAQRAALMPGKTEQELIEQFGGIAFEKQSALASVIGEQNWKVDINNGQIIFGEDIVLPVQIIGSFSHSAETWLWSWANTQASIPPALLEHAELMKKYGAEHGIKLFTEGGFDADKEELHLFGMIASGMFDASGYYLADYGAGTMLLTVKSPLIDDLEHNDHLRILTFFPQLISNYGMDHRNALRSYLILKGYTVTEDGDHLKGIQEGQTITALFDGLRLSSLKG
ncbi:hypothetical protein PBAL39_23647 [Pedobacter sp. BAL39]|uniref:DUF6882 domain-containing protein n=1 Tax=Pedobacter sp. BAL39 TaxID=391596 RepID=UPI0001559429|nr:DUF6882 domain-containing protein [Pedobacter sp. BAL39]EDM36055.1 hypothetical protein PBAL39_23647 [Pedobacter sp. BAL39]